MNTIEKSHKQNSAPTPLSIDASGPSEVDSSANLIKSMLRRWHIVLAAFLLICATGIPAVWLLIKPMYAATAAIRVAPVIPSILFKDSDSDSVIPMYRNFVNTQADLIKSDQVLQRVADDLIDTNPELFKDGANPIARLRRALSKKQIEVDTDRNSELIKITTKSLNSEEASQIVNAFVKAYMAVEVSREAKGGDHKLTVLENERRVLTEKLERQRQTVHQMAAEYGSLVLTDRQEIMLQQVANLQTELSKVQTRKVTLETQQKLLEETNQGGISPAELLKMRYDFINSNPAVQQLSNNTIQLEQALIAAKQTMTAINPELQRKTELLQALEDRLKEKRAEIGKTFDDMMVEEAAKTREEQSANIKAELAQVTDYEKRLEDMLVKENTETIELGRKHLAIQDQQEQLALTKELYDTVLRRIQELEMERKRPARISVAYNANITPVPNKRVKYTIAIILGSLACGMFLAILMDKVDRKLHTPDDVINRVGVRIIGTISKIDRFEGSAPQNQVTYDYQTIRANLGLLDGGQVPNKLVVTSAGMRDGKTTFAINLASSLAKAGKKVLLVDGDLRKPDIRRLLKLSKDSTGLQDILSGKIEDVICQAASAGFHVLTGNSQCMANSFELLSMPNFSNHLNAISKTYDHIIIDTPPVLAFPDGLLWAKAADGVILTGFSGRSKEQDLREALERLAQAKANVLGIVLNNVSDNNSYYRYGYSYHVNQGKNRSNYRGRKIISLPTVKSQKSTDHSKL